MDSIQIATGAITEFAIASGDVNPLHVDAGYAAKTSFGEPVTHGALIVLYALGTLGPRSTPLPIRRLAARFHAAVFPGQDYDAVVESRDEHGVHLQVRRHGRLMADLTVELAERALDIQGTPVAGGRRTEAADVALADLVENAKLEISYETTPGAYRGLLERCGAAAAGVTCAQATLLGWASYLAGMELPGKQAVLSGLTVEFGDYLPDAGVVEVKRVDARRGLLALAGKLPGWGRVELAVASRSVSPEPDADAVRTLVGDGQPLAGKVALVIGGSRGLGAGVAQALALQGAEVYVTHRRGSVDAERVKTGLGVAGERVRLVSSDAADTDANQALLDRVIAGHGRLDLLVLNAFPPLREGDPGYVERALAAVREPLAALAPAVAAAAGKIVLVSSAAVHEPPPGWEYYAEAKRRSEDLLRDTVAARPTIGGLLVRPPRLDTGFVGTFGDADRGMPVATAAVTVVKHAAAGEPGVVTVVDDLPARESTARGTVAVAATFTLDPLAEPLRAWITRLGLDLDVRFAPYAQVFQELLSPAGVLSEARSGCAVVLVRLDDWPACDLDRNLTELTSAVRAFAARRGVPLVVQVCPSPSAEVTADPRERRLADELAGLPGVHVAGGAAWDGGVMVAEPHDPARLRMAHIPYTAAGYTALAAGLSRSVHALLGNPFKVLVLDCDNTLWQGVAGEDGPDGIVLTPACLSVQRWAVELRARGIVVCLASKNDPDTIAEVFRRREDMPLRAEHVVASAVGWSAKSEGIRGLVAELGLGLDSVVFLDDNPVEVAEVRAACPEVLALTLPAEPDAVPAFLGRVWAFDRMVVTDEDRARAESYQANHRRNQSQRGALTFAGFIEGLGLRVDVRPAAEADLDRLVQLTQRTNQFNSTTIRRQEADLRALLASPGCRCDVVRAQDRFGDYGLVGMVVHVLERDAVVVDTLLLSCRTLGRGVEHQVLAKVGERALAEALPLRVRYRPTAKNTPVRVFLESIGAAPGGDFYTLDAEEAAGIRFRPEDVVEVSAEGTPATGPAFVDYARLRALTVLAEGNLPELVDDDAGEAVADDALPIVAEVLTRVLGVADVGAGVRIADLEASSLAFIEATVMLERWFGPLEPDLFYVHKTLGDLAAALAPSRLADTAAAEPEADFEAVVDRLVGNAKRALADFETMDQEQVDHIVERAAMAALGAHLELAELAVRETGRGSIEDKAVKNLFAVEHISNSMAGLRTVGEVRDDELAGVVDIVEPVGVVCAITPSTSPTAVVVFKALIALKTRNPIIFSFHHLAAGSGARAAGIVRDAAIAAGAPEHCVQWLGLPAREATRTLMRHAGVALVLATGGNELVRAAYSAGKPAIGVGAGNVPAFVAADADVRRAVNDIVLSRTFDNGTSCAAEQTLIVDASVWGATADAFGELHAHVATAEEKRALESVLFGAVAGTPECHKAMVSPAAMGLPAVEIARQAGFTVAEGTSVILVEVAEVGPGEPLTRSKPFPVLAVLKVGDADEGVRQAAKVVDFHGQGHTAVVHTADEGLVRRFGDEVKAVRVVWNAPGAQGGMGDIYNAFLPSLTLGCGSYGGNSVSGNVTAANLLNVRRIARRNNNIQWFKVPPKIYFEPNALGYLAQMPDVSRVSLVTGPTLAKLGYVEKVSRILRSRPEPVAIQVIDFVEPEPSVETARRGAELMREFEPDTIIAIGGGSSMDAGKVMWLWYEQPQVSFSDMKEKFFDIRKRTFTFPRLGERARLVCVPTTSGSGSEVTPFAVVTDKSTGAKYPLADYALTPSVAIVDPVLVLGMPEALAADSGFDALTHATEAYVSVFANDFTDGLCLQAIKLIFDNLERSVRYGAADPKAREKVHNASTIAGMAFGNAFLGIVHAMSHTLGSTYGIAHGRANALLLPHVIRYNGRPPTKLSGWPKYESYQAPQRFQDIARMLGLPAQTPSQAVLSYAEAIERLRDAVGIPRSFAALGIDEAGFIDDLPRQAMNAYQDQCAPANPRMPVLKDMEALMREAYYFTDGLRAVPVHDEDPRPGSVVPRLPS
ncbi:bifunctional acetaldehyde-CoA/alcohol dehydrogenase [Amycolatopsis sp. cg5]|uniref:bifunctional acetaldehyde-CoA/alcohol dehydrogenase n=1 Tax=Amycolatopsis sp. cg5 TaxID=3238802 RepID=UPI003525A8F7